jgi:hypothetical protein
MTTGLVEAKNGAAIRKHMGYGHIAAPPAERIQGFYEQHFNTYLNLHRPCAQADVEIDAKGKQRRRYKRYQTPLETLLALSKAAQFLRRGCHAALFANTSAAEERHTSRARNAAGQTGALRGNAAKCLRPWR